MKKVTRLLILAAFVCPLLFLSKAYAGGPGTGPRGISSGERQRLGLEPIISTDPYRLQDPIGGNVPDIDRDNLLERDPFGGRDPYPLSGQNHWDTGTGGGTAPLDGGISLLLAAGLGLGLKKVRARKLAAERKNVETAG